VRIEVRGKNVEVTEELREAVIQRFERVGKQVSDLAQLEVELYEEKNPRISDRMGAEATLYLKGVTLRARAAASDMNHAINVCEDQLARQVKRHREQRRKRRATRAAQQAANGLAGGGASAA
jgi:putative sigma-54 modulation protein